MRCSTHPTTARPTGHIECFPLPRWCPPHPVWSRIREPKPTSPPTRGLAGEGCTQQQVKDWLKSKRLSPHHAGGNEIQLIKWELHGNPSAVPPINGIRHMGAAYDLRNP